MTGLRSVSDVLRRLALADPRLAFETIEGVHGLTRADPSREPPMLCYDGDETKADSVFRTSLEGTPVAIASYPYGTIAIAIGTDHLTLVRREHRGHLFLDSWYVYQEELERYRATGLFGDVRDHDPASFLTLLEEHGILAEHGLTPRGETWNADYVGFLRSRHASGNVIDA